MFYNRSSLTLSKTTPSKSNTSVRKFNQHNSKKINTALVAVLKSPSKSSFDKLAQSLVIEVEPSTFATPETTTSRKIAAPQAQFEEHKTHFEEQENEIREGIRNIK